jgi:hypothetical protein
MNENLPSMTCVPDQKNEHYNNKVTRYRRVYLNVPALTLIVNAAEILSGAY